MGGPAYVDVLREELRSLGARIHDHSEVAAGALLVTGGAAAPLDPAFARQVLPGACLVENGTANELASAVLEVCNASGASLVPADVEVALPELPRKGSKALEEHPLTSAREDVARLIGLKVEGRRAKHGAPPATGHQLRVLLVDTWRAWVSISKRSGAPALIAWPSPFVGGRPIDEEARDAPSSAHRKIDEALAWLETGPGPGDVVLDLGAAPGGWSWACLERGADVIAVDRADLHPEIARHGRLTHVRADAFRYVPERQPTWLICDVIVDPERSLDLAVGALSSRHLRGLVVTLKLKRPVPTDVLKKARAVARSTPGFFGRVKQLASNKLEVTMMMRRRQSLDVPETT